VGASPEDTPLPGPVQFHYTRRGDEFTPSPLAVGPWKRSNQNGLSLAGLASYLMDGLPAPAPMVPTRVTIDILRPTPFVPVRGTARVVREGRRLQLIEAKIFSEREETVRASLLRVRHLASPPSDLGAAPTPPPPTDRSFGSPRSAIRSTLETRLIRGGLEELGPGSLWSKFDGEVVEGEPMSPLCRTAMTADFGSGLSAFVDWRQWTFANLDVSLHLIRLPQSEWLKLDAESLSAGEGFAVVDARLFDIRGLFGICHQTLFLEPVSK
jgi:hypothetical protein